MTAGRGGPGEPPRRLGPPDLPAVLRAIPRPVAGLWYLGDPAALEGAPARHVAIVGTREATPYGIRVAEHLATACARAGLVVVSGLARGIDAAAHRAALAAGGATIGVQGTGVDVPYPASHRALHAAVAARGLVVSEMEPGTRATPGCFPRRNRIIAALCKVVAVVEAPFKSGAINTASQALELGRAIAAVPGRIDDPAAAGSNQLLRDGAHVIAEASDLLVVAGLSTSDARSAMLGFAYGVPDADPETGGETAGIRSGASSDTGPDAGADPDVLSVRRTAERLLAAELQGRIARSWPPIPGG